MALIDCSDERTMLLETAMDFCANRSPVSEVRKRIDEDLGFDEGLWRELTDLGWLAIAIPEAYGGLGLGLGDVAVAPPHRRPVTPLGAFTRGYPARAGIRLGDHALAGLSRGIVGARSCLESAFPPRSRGTSA